MSKEMTGAEMVIQALADQGIKHIFGYPGGAVLRRCRPGGRVGLGRARVAGEVSEGSVVQVDLEDGQLAVEIRVPEEVAAGA